MPSSVWLKTILNGPLHNGTLRIQTWNPRDAAALWGYQNISKPQKSRWSWGIAPPPATDVKFNLVTASLEASASVSQQLSTRTTFTWLLAPSFWIQDSAPSHLCCSTSCWGSQGEHGYKSNHPTEGKLSWQENGRESRTQGVNTATGNGLNDHTLRGRNHASAF